MDKIRVILFGMAGFGNNSLKVLTKEPFIELVGVVTPKRESSPFPYYKCKKLQDVAISKNIPLYEGLILKENKTYELIKSLKPDLIIVSSFRQIVPKNIISIPRLGVINIHPSLLPKYRGPTPTIWALMNKEKETGVTIHFIEDEKIDSGRIITHARLKILKSDIDSSLRKKLALLSEKALIKALQLILEKDKSFFLPQNNRKATYYPRYKRTGIKNDK